MFAFSAPTLELFLKIAEILKNPSLQNEEFSVFVFGKQFVVRRLFTLMSRLKLPTSYMRVS